MLSRQGVLRVTKPCQLDGWVRPARPLTWQMTEEGVTRMLLWLPMIEVFYEILPTFWTGGIAEPFQWRTMVPDPAFSSHVWLGKPTLTEVRWLPRGRLHVVVTWQCERPDQRPRHHSIPFFWAGLLPQEDYRSRSLRLGSPFIRCARGPNDPIWWDREPPVVAIGQDEFAAFRSRTAYGDDVQVGAVDTAGHLVWSAEGSHSEWTLGQKPPPARSIGHPEVAAIAEGPDLVNLGGVRGYRIVGFLADFRAATEAQLVKAFSMSRGEVKKAVNLLEELGLVTRVGEYLYVTPRGRQMFAARDRIDGDRLTEVTHLDPEGEAAKKERRHDSTVAGVAAVFRGAGYSVVAGWRWVVSWHGGQLDPDLWVQMPIPGETAAFWVPLEIEFSATGPQRIGRDKLRSYRLAPLQLKQDFPILVITGEELPAKRFDNLARGLEIYSTTLKKFLTGVWEGPESVWCRKGEPVGLSAVTQRYRSHLWQQTGQAVDNSVPAPEVWTEFFRQEIVVGDPLTEGWMEWETNLPPMSAELQAGIDEVFALPHDASAVPPARSPVAVTVPPSRSPEPVRETVTDRDRAPQRWDVLRGINLQVAEADRIAEQRLKQDDLNAAERLCLQRVRAIITYGAAQHHQVGERRVENIVHRCLMLEDQHLQEVRSGNVLWWLTVAQTQTDPGKAFANLLGDFPGVRQASCRLFNGWSKVVDREVRAARRGRTLH